MGSQWVVDDMRKADRIKFLITSQGGPAHDPTLCEEMT